MRHPFLIHPQFIFIYSVALVVGFNVLVALDEDWMYPMATLKVPLTMVYLMIAYHTYYHKMVPHPRDIIVVWMLKLGADISGLVNHIIRYEVTQPTQFAFLITFICFDLYAALCISNFMVVCLGAEQAYLSSNTKTLLGDQSRRQKPTVEVEVLVESPSSPSRVPESPSPSRVLEKTRGKRHVK